MNPNQYVTTLVALVKREVQEHKNLWKVPLILLGIALLVKLSLMFGNLSIDINLPAQSQLNGAVHDFMNTVVGKAVNWVNHLVMLVMFIVSLFYALSCLYNERQDESVLFWRSLPISDSQTILSKLLVAVVLVPVVVVICQALIAVVFFGGESTTYLSSYFSYSLSTLFKVVLWSLLPTVCWCMFCSEIAKKNPFLLAIVAPILLVIVDKLFLNGTISQIFLINRLTGVDHYTLSLLLSGSLFAVACLFGATVKRSQRF